MLICPNFALCVIKFFNNFLKNPVSKSNKNQRVGFKLNNILKNPVFIKESNLSYKTPQVTMSVSHFELPFPIVLLLNVGNLSFWHIEVPFCLQLSQSIKAFCRSSHGPQTPFLLDSKDKHEQAFVNTMQYYCWFLNKDWYPCHVI